MSSPHINTLRPIQNGRHFTDDIFKYIFLNENVWILINISLKSIRKCPINNIPALVQIMAWHRPGDKPLSEQMMVSLLTHICVTRPQWVNPDIVSHHRKQGIYQNGIFSQWPSPRVTHAYEHWILRTFKYSHLNQIHIFQRICQIFCVDLQTVSLTFHSMCLTHTLKDIEIFRAITFKNSCAFLNRFPYTEHDTRHRVHWCYATNKQCTDSIIDKDNILGCTLTR